MLLVRRLWKVWYVRFWCFEQRYCLWHWLTFLFYWQVRRLIAPYRQLFGYVRIFVHKTLWRSLLWSFKLNFFLMNKLWIIFDFGVILLIIFPKFCLNYALYLVWEVSFLFVLARGSWNLSYLGCIEQGKFLSIKLMGNGLGVKSLLICSSTFAEFNGLFSGLRSFKSHIKIKFMLVIDFDLKIGWSCVLWYFFLNKMFQIRLIIFQECNNFFV